MGLREDYIHHLKLIKPFDGVERAAQARAISWIEGGGSIFRRDKSYTAPNDRHFVCYFPMVDFEAQRIFLAFHRKAKLWIPPGGHIEEAETPLEATIRECGEELGIPARFIDSRPFFLSSVTTQNTTDPHTDIAFWFVLISSEDESLTLDEAEFSASGWFDIGSSDGAKLRHPVPLDTEPNMSRFLIKLSTSDTYAFSAKSRDWARRVKLPALIPS
jgi:8-oxo-dGTP pyrophosphatase MutT (NUDIX family)